MHPIWNAVRSQLTGVIDHVHVFYSQRADMVRTVLRNVVLPFSVGMKRVSLLTIIEGLSTLIRAMTQLVANL